MKGVTCINRNEGQLDRHGKPKPPSWAYRFEVASVGGKRQYVTKSGFATKADALVAGAKAFTKYNTTGSVFRETKMSYADCLDRWFEDYVKIKCNDVTQGTYQKNLRLYIKPALGKYALISIKRETIQTFINDMHKQKFSRNTLVNILGMITSSLRFARKQGWIEVNPAEDIDLPGTRECRQNRKKVREPVPEYTLRQIFKRFPEGTPAHVPFMLAYHCGMRLGEVFGLTWDDVDLDWGVLYVKQQVQWSQPEHVYHIVPPKYDSFRQIKLDCVILELLRREHKRQLESRLQYGEKYTHIFVDEDDVLNTEGRGAPISLVCIREDGTYIQPRTTQYYAKVIKRELGYEKFDFHSLRHTHATELSEEGVNIKEIQRRLGHSTMEVTSKKYLHATDRMEAESVELMNRRFGATAPESRTG